MKYLYLTAATVACVYGIQSFVFLDIAWPINTEPDDRGFFVFVAIMMTGAVLLID